MEKIALKQLQDLQNRKAEFLIELGKILHSLYRNGSIDNPDISGLCTEITKLDAQIGQLLGAGVNKDSGTCPNCKQQIAPNSVFCPGCGFGVQEFLSKGVKYCGFCGGSITSDCVWCPICGAKL